MAFRAVRDVETHQIASPDWETATGLQRLGLQPGDRIAYIGDPIQADFARLARVKMCIRDSISLARARCAHATPSSAADR